MRACFASAGYAGLTFWVSRPCVRPCDIRTRCGLGCDGRWVGVLDSTPPSTPPTVPPATPPVTPPVTPAMVVGGAGAPCCVSLTFCIFCGMRVGVRSSAVGLILATGRGFTAEADAAGGGGGGGGGGG